MRIINTGLSGLLIIEPDVFEDERGYFFESYNTRKLSECRINTVFHQDNQSKSMYGVIRGLHFQREPFSQTKLIRVLEGEIFDIAVDIRLNSPTFGKWFGLNLSSENKQQLFIPGGFAHGFSVLSETAVVFYKCDKYYNPDAEGGIIYNDKFLHIDWKIPDDRVIVSAKDMVLPTFESAKKNFNFVI